jgi:HSP20 family molecular chaperone IbpA
MQRPDNFLPSIDIISNDKYIIYMDVPGLKKDDILITR